jgi:Tfp pilus assembly protein PilP
MTAMVITIVLMLALAGAEASQAPQPASAPQPLESIPAPPADYSYAPDDRRDPFVSLVNSGVDTRRTATAGTRPDGIAGVLVDEIAVRGIVQSRGTWVAMVAAPNGRTYTVRPGDRLLDGSVRAITAQAVVLLQDVNDPLSLAKHREIRKPLRGEIK